MKKPEGDRLMRMLPLNDKSYICGLVRKELTDVWGPHF